MVHRKKGSGLIFHCEGKGIIRPVYSENAFFSIYFLQPHDQIERVIASHIQSQCISLYSAKPICATGHLWLCYALHETLDGDVVDAIDLTVRVLMHVTVKDCLHLAGSLEDVADDVPLLDKAVVWIFFEPGIADETLLVERMVQKYHGRFVGSREVLLEPISLRLFDLDICMIYRR